MLAIEDIDILESAAEILWPSYGAWAYEEWRRLNLLCFGGELSPVGVLWGLTPHGRSQGHYRAEDQTITLHLSLIENGSLLDKHHASDVLLHEMVHQRISELDMPSTGTSAHNCQAWVSEVNRISPLLGLEVRAAVVRQKRIDGKVRWSPEVGFLSQKELAEWPHSVRLRPAGSAGIRRS